MKAQTIFLSLSAATLLAVFGVASRSQAPQAQKTSVAPVAAPSVLAPVKVAQNAKLFEPTREQRNKAKQAFGKMPLSFEPNMGQTHKQFQFTANGTGFNFFLKPTEATILLRNPSAKQNKAKPHERTALKLKLMGANDDVKISGSEALIARSNYFIGNDHHLSNIPNYGKVVCEQVYPGIDMVYYGNQSQLEYDFVVAPNADPSVIKLSISGQDSAELDAIGNLVLSSKGSKITQQKPFIYQRDNAGASSIIKGEYLIEAAKNGAAVVSFKLDSYDKSLPLVIDPVLVYSTFFGDKPNNPPEDRSDQSGDEVGTGIAIDAQGNAYVVGFTNSYEFPTLNPIEVISDPIIQDDNHLNYHYNPEKYFVFITKFNPAGSALIFSTKFGGGPVVPVSDAIPTKNDIGVAIAVDNVGSIYVTGSTNQSTFPVKNALHIATGGVDTFLMKLSTDGGNLFFSTYLGGQGDDTPSDLVLDGLGFVYIVGTTNSTDLPVSAAYQPQLAGGTDAFVAKFKVDGSEQTFCTYLGGLANDSANGAATDASGNLFITGSTSSVNFPFAAPLQVANNGGTDAFVTKMNANGSLLIYSTYLGGGGNDRGNSIAVDFAGSAYVTGTTMSTNFPTISQTVLPVQTALQGTSDAFVTKIDKFGAALIYSTYFGGEADETGVKIRVDSRGAVYVIGTTSSVTSAFPIQPGTNTLQASPLHNRPVDPFVPTRNTGQNSFVRPLPPPSSPPTPIPVSATQELVVAVPPRPVASEGFLAKFNPTGTPLVYSTYLGADTHDFVFEAFDAFYHAIAIGRADLTMNRPVTVFDRRNTVVTLNGLAVDNSGNAYITGSTEGSFLYTFGAFSTIAPKFASPGEDFPAPFTRTGKIPLGPHTGEDEFFPSESTVNPLFYHDDRDVIICKIGDSSPLITSPQTKLGTLGLSLSYNIVATNNPTSYNAAGLPPGLFVNTADGAISGLPTQTGNFQVVLTATNASGTGAIILYLTISQLAPVITSPLSVFANVNTVFQYQITADNNPGTFTATNLPLGLSLDTNIGLISGTPLVPSTSNVPISAINASGSDTKTLVINVLPPLPVITSATNTQGVFNLAYTANAPLYTITATNNPSQYNAIGLPPGLVVSQATGKITGTATSLGFFNVTITATNGGGTTSSLWKLSIIPPVVPGITSPGIATGTVNEPFTFTISATNNPLSYGITPSLPPGLILNDVTGVISGIPTMDGVFALTMQASNSSGTGTKDLTLTIVLPAAPVITSPLSATAIANTPFEYDIQAANRPTSFNALNLPAGLSINTTTGKISGTTSNVTPPNTPFNIDIFATNSGGTGSAVLALTVIPQQIPVILSTGTVEGFVNLPLSYQIIANGLPTSFGAVGLPPGMSINTVNGLISGTPNTVVGSPFVATVSATNAVGTGNKTVTFTISTPVAPVFTSPNSALGNDGAAFSYTISATGSAPIIFTAAPLPIGLSQINNTTIFGKPSGGTTVVILTAYNPRTNPTTPNGPPNPGGIPPVTFSLTLNIAAAPATISNTILTATATVGTAFNFAIQTSGTVPINVSATTQPAPDPVMNPLPAPTLPSGLTLTGSVAAGFAITGTPTASAVTLNGPVAIALMAANSVGGNTKTLLLTVNQARPDFTSSTFATGIEGSPFRYALTATGTQVINYTVTGLPAGLTFANGIISGTPTPAAIGLSNVTLTAQNQGGSDTITLVIQIDPAIPVITNPLTVSGSAGVPFSFTLTANGSPEIVYSASLLPPGLVLISDKISGIPTTSGTFNAVINATNDAGTDTETLIFTILPAPPIISGAVVPGFDGVPLTFTPTFTGSTPITFSAAGLPPGLTINPLTGTISGTPTGPGTFPATISAVNPGGSGSQVITFSISPSAPIITSVLQAAGSPGVAFSYTITAVGTPIITYQVGNLASVPGLTQAGNVISGIPTGPLGTTAITLIATNPFGQDVKVLALQIAQTPPALTNALVVNGQDGQPFSFFLKATGSPVIVFGATPLPPGLTLNTSTGEISGTPTVVGLTNASISATNTFGLDTGKVLAISIAASPARITSALNADGGLGELFTYQITATGTAPITFNANALPPGLSINTANGVISGFPQAQGVTLSNIIATNGAGSDTKQLRISITPRPPIITSPLTATASTTAPFNYTITATGQPTITYTVTGLPAGLTFSNNTITGQAQATGVFTVTITATNPAGTDTKTLILTVGDDVDGDGFPDDFENFLGTNPSNPNSNGFVNGKGSIAVLNITSMRVKLDFKTAGKDSLSVKGTLPLAQGFSAAGKQVVIYISGISAKITLDSKGVAKGTTSFSIKPGRSSDPVFSFAINKANLKVPLAKLGMTNENVLAPRTVSTLVLVLINNSLVRSDKVLNYTARAGKQGSAK